MSSINITPPKPSTCQTCQREHVSTKFAFQCTTVPWSEPVSTAALMPLQSCADKCNIMKTTCLKLGFIYLTRWVSPSITMYLSSLPLSVFTCKKKRGSGGRYQSVPAFDPRSSKLLSSSHLVHSFRPQTCSHLTFKPVLLCIKETFLMCALVSVFILSYVGLLFACVWPRHSPSRQVCGAGEHTPAHRRLLCQQVFSDGLLLSLPAFRIG